MRLCLFMIYPLVTSGSETDYDSGLSLWQFDLSDGTYSMLASNDDSCASSDANITISDVCDLASDSANYVYYVQVGMCSQNTHTTHSTYMMKHSKVSKC